MSTRGDIAIRVGRRMAQTDDEEAAYEEFMTWLKELDSGADKWRTVVDDFSEGGMAGGEYIIGKHYPSKKAPSGYVQAYVTWDPTTQQVHAAWQAADADGAVIAGPSGTIGSVYVGTSGISAIDGAFRQLVDATETEFAKT